MTVFAADLSTDVQRTPRVFALLVKLLSANWTYGRLTLTLPKKLTNGSQRLTIE